MSGKPSIEQNEYRDSFDSRAHITGEKGQEHVDHIEHVDPLPEWWLSKYLVGYSSKRMLRFKNPNHYYWAINLLAGLAILFYGYDQGVMSLVNLNEDYLRRMGIYPTEGNSRNLAALGGIVSVYYGGSLIGALCGGTVADKAGRINAIFLGVLVSIIGGIFQASAMNITWMCCARVVTGLGVGAIDAVIPVWSAEVSSHQARGSFLALEFFLNIAGLSLAYWIEIFAGLNSNKVLAWRVPLALQLVFLFGIISLIPFFPESPRYLAKVGRIEEAREVLYATRSGPTAELDAELRAIVKSTQHDARNEGDNRYIRMIFAKTKVQKELRWRVILSIWLQIMQELVGIGVITVYAVDLIQGAGFSLSESKLLAGFNNISYMFSVLFAVFTLDRCGRRSTMIWGAVGMAILLLIAGILDKYAQEGGPHQRQFGAGVVAMTFLYTGTFGATWLVTPWLYPTELFPTYVRAKGGAWSVVGWSIGNGVVTMITPFLFDAIKYGVLLLLMGLNIFVIPFVIFMYPETSGRPLEQIDDYFSNSTSWNVFKGSRQVRDNGLADWQWTRRYQGGVEHGDVESKSTSDSEKSGQQKENGVFRRMKRMASDAGLM